MSRLTRLAASLSLSLLVGAALSGCPGGGDGVGFVGVSEPQKPAGPPPVKHLTIEVNGDLLIHSPIWNLALQQGGGTTYDFNPMLALVKPTIEKADLAVCHVETPMSNRPPTGFPIFNTPEQLAGAIKATGWDVCDTASNHSLDGGHEGIDSTVAALDRAGVRHTGSYATAAGPETPLILNVKGTKIAWLAYTEMTNGIPLPHPYSVGIASAPRILADARRAKAAGAQAVIVNLHAGAENQSQPSDFQTNIVRQLVASPDITAVVGQHVHVVQPIEMVGGKFVVFGEGNFLSNQTPNCCPAASQDGIIGLLHLTAQGSKVRVDKVDYIPVWVRHPDFVVVPVSLGLAKGLAPADELRASWNRTTSVVGTSVAKPR